MQRSTLRCRWPSPPVPAYPSSVSLMMSQISMLRAQSSLCREPSVAFSEEKKPQVTKVWGVLDDKLTWWGGNVWGGVGWEEMEREDDGCFLGTRDGPGTVFSTLSHHVT